MKKLFFSFVMLVTLVIVAGSAKGQDAVNPYLDATYSYTVAAISPANSNTVEVYITSDAGGSTRVTPTGSYTLSSPTGADLTLDNSNKLYKGTLSSSTVGFDLVYSSVSGSTFAGATGTTPYYLWIKVYSGDNLTCNNYKYIIIKPKANDFNLTIASAGNNCQKVVTPTAENTMGSEGQSNDFSYTVTQAGVGTGQYWSFTLSLDNTSMSYNSNTNSVSTPSISVIDGTGTVGVVTAYSNGSITLKVPSTATSVKLSFNIATTPGASTTIFKGTLSNEKLLNTAGTVTLYTVTDSSSDNASVELKQVPYIGSFTGVN